MTKKGFFVRLSTGLLAVGALSGCAMLDGNQQEAMNQESDYANYEAQRNGTAEALDELGWAPSRRLSEDEQLTLEKRTRLKRLEKNIPSERERDQYFGFKPYLDNDDERIYFLNLSSPQARDRYAMQKGIYFRTNKFTPDVREAVSHSDIILGMNKEAVIESWGEPADVEVAGAEMYGNERWRYVEYVSTSEGYQREERLVIFEGGRVVGWQRN